MYPTPEIDVLYMLFIFQDQELSSYFLVKALILDASSSELFLTARSALRATPQVMFY